MRLKMVITYEWYIIHGNFAQNHLTKETTYRFFFFKFNTAPVYAIRSAKYV